jgi:outer membrane protein, adhesin transport system
MMMKFLRSGLAWGALLAAMGAAPAQAQSIVESVRIALESNPQIGQAEQNREAIEFELKQALGLYAPRVDLEASVGAQILNNPSRRALGIENDPLYPSQIGVTVSYDLFDGGFRDAETDRQAARVDGASHRVLERSEFIALQISRLYFEIVLQNRIIDLSRQNVAFHQFTLDSVSDAIQNGQLTEADRFQAIERLAASRARVVEAMEQLESSKIEYYQYVGIPYTNGGIPAPIGSGLPPRLDAAIESGRINNPRILLSLADIDAAAALVRQAESGLAPKVQLEGRASAGYDFGGANGETYDLQGRLVMRWNIFDGGIRSATVQEQMRRESEALLALHQVHREVEEAVRVSWERMARQRELANVYRQQMDASADLVGAYQEQFNVGDRSLLDVLDSQNTRYNLQVLHETAQYSARFAEYRLMAASGLLLSHLGVRAPTLANAQARETFNVPSFDEFEPRPRQEPIFSQPLNLTSFGN